METSNASLLRPADTPLSKLPQEVLLQIMLTMATEDQRSGWRLAGVSQSWRKLALSCSRIWQSLQVTTSCSDVHQMFKLWHERVRHAPVLVVDLAILSSSTYPARILWDPARSREALSFVSNWCFPPLDLPSCPYALKAPHPEGAFDYRVHPLMAIVERARTLKLCIDHASTWRLLWPCHISSISAPFLETLIIVYNNTSTLLRLRHEGRLPNIDSPRLRSLSLTCAPWFTPTPELTVLQLGQPYALQAVSQPPRAQTIPLRRLVDILHHCKNLIVLEVHLPLTMPEDNPINPVLLSCRCIGVSGHYGTRALLDHIEARHLDALYVHVDDVNIDNSLAELHDRSGSPSITEFRYVSSRANSMAQCPLGFISRLTKLLTLTLVQFRVNQVLEILDDSQDHTARCPSLKKLRLLECTNTSRVWSGRRHALEVHIIED